MEEKVVGDSKSDKLPVAIYFIIPNEACERFAYFGIQGLFNQYLKSGFGLPTHQAKSYVHLFSGLVYFCPLAGAVISDSYLGKYHTILYLSFPYLLGNILLTLFSVPGLVGNFGEYPVWSFLMPALLIAIGSGGIKPCVSSHGGDQFLPSQAKLMDRFFTLFYVAINLGVFASSFVTPYIKEYVSCFGYSCYAAAYGVPTVFFVCSMALFVFGKRYYRVVPPQGEFLPWKAVKLAVLALRRYYTASPEERQSRHWLSFAEGSYGPEFIEETRQIGGVIVMFIPIVFHWFLYSQNVTEWQNQYEKMDKHLFSLIPIPTEASSLSNPIMILFMVPFFCYKVYPFLESRGWKLSLYGRMQIGSALVILSFILSNLLTFFVDRYTQNMVIENNVVTSCVGCLNGAWQLPQYIILTLGEAMISPTISQFAYREVGPQMRASSRSVSLLSVSIGNYLIAVMESMVTFDAVNKQWLCISISSFSLFVSFLLSRFWFESRILQQESSLR